MKYKPLLLADMFFRDGFKFLGYQMGLHEKVIPLVIKKCISTSPNYWR